MSRQESPISGQESRITDTPEIILARIESFLQEGIGSARFNAFADFVAEGIASQRVERLESSSRDVGDPQQSLSAEGELSSARLDSALVRERIRVSENNIPAYASSLLYVDYEAGCLAYTIERAETFPRHVEPFLAESRTLQHLSFLREKIISRSQPQSF